MNLKQLSAPFPANDVEWRIQSSGVKGDGTVWARCLAYITNRAIMDRLDEVCEPHQWKNEYRHEANGAVMCGISIKIGDEWVTKWDGAENTDIEAVKGGLSGAMKRAGYQWGIGRYLYQLEEGFARVSENGAHYAKTKDGKTFRWDAPALPAFALPGGSASAVGEARSQSHAASASATQPTAAPIIAKLREQVAAVESRPVPTIDERAPLDETDPNCPTCGGKMWDNRLTKKNPKAPDYKCRDRGCEGVIWPPKTASASPAPKSNGKSAVAIPPIDDTEYPFDMDDA